MDDARVTPRPWMGWAIGLLYAPVFISVLIASGVEYDEFTDSAANVRDAAVIPLVVMTIIVAVLISVLGWWRPVLRDDLGAPRLWRWIPILWAVGTVVSIDYPRIGKLDPDYIMWAAVASVLVGFAEESAYRGLSLVGFRSGYSEARVWLFSTLLFMYLHAFNYIAGQDLGPTIGQLVFTFVLGSVLYAVRRTTGSLVVCMILHGAWDFTSFTATSNAFENPDELVDPRKVPIAMIFLIAMAVLFVMGRKQALAAPATATAGAA